MSHNGKVDETGMVRCKDKPHSQCTTKQYFPFGAFWITLAISNPRICRVQMRDSKIFQGNDPKPCVVHGKLPADFKAFQIRWLWMVLSHLTLSIKNRILMLSRIVITKLYIVNEERTTPLEINASITVMYFWTGKKPSGNVSVNDKESLETWLDS